MGLFWISWDGMGFERVTKMDTVFRKDNDEET
jgi:hypothetical protein